MAGRPSFSRFRSARGKRFGIAVSRFHEPLTRRLLRGAVTTLCARGVRTADIRVVWVPGAFELPLAAQRLARRRPDAVICLGVVIRGATPHFDYVAGCAAQGIAQVALRHRLPVIFGVVTADSQRQAQARVTKGRDAALSAIEMIHLQVCPS
ncbi:MAG: 6,7-dimethyl-8-ribityllumazine synthase [Candidatus Omnitrophica bacterium]|nr:6,7-dimethyl-8-ribityllumazine synthase [Candidatus Omnitrophota bacterium]